MKYLYPCGHIGAARSAKILGYEDEVYCVICGGFFYPEDLVRVYDSATSDASKAPGSASSAGASPLGEFMEQPFCGPCEYPMEAAFAGAPHTCSTKEVT